MNVKIDPKVFEALISEGVDPKEALERAKVTSQTSEHKRYSRLMTLSKTVSRNINDAQRLNSIIALIAEEIRGKPVPKAVPVAKSKGTGKFIRWDFVGDESPTCDEIRQALDESEVLLKE